MMNIKTIGKIHSLGGKEDEITVLKQCGDNDYIVDYKGVKCHALFNFFVGRYYVDDIYGKVESTTITELKEYLENNPDCGNFEVQKDSKEEVKLCLHNHGFMCEPSENGNRIHIEYWRKQQ